MLSEGQEAVLEAIGGLNCHLGDYGAANPCKLEPHPCLHAFHCLQIISLE